MTTVLQITDKRRGEGGIWQVVASHADALSQRGYDVRRFLLGEPDNPITLKKHLRDDHPLMANLRAKAKDVDLIHLHLGFSALSPDFVKHAAQLAPMVVNLHDVSPFDGAKETGLRGLKDRLQQLRLRPVRRAVWQMVCDYAALIIAPSQFLAELAETAGVHPDRISHVPHAVAPADIASVQRQKGVILYVGMLSDHKGAPLLLEAFSELEHSNAQLWFVGNGAARHDIQTRALVLGLSDRVRFFGQLPADQVQTMMRTASVLAHPSLIAEGFGLVGIEAMQVGCPVVGFGSGGATDWLHDGKTGLVVTPRSASALAAGLDRVLQDDALAARLGQEGRQFVTTTYHPDRIASLLIDCYEAVLAGTA